MANKVVSYPDEAAKDLRYIKSLISKVQLVFNAKRDTCWIKGNREFRLVREPHSINAKNEFGYRLQRIVPYNGTWQTITTLCGEKAMVHGIVYMMRYSLFGG